MEAKTLTFAEAITAAYDAIPAEYANETFERKCHIAHNAVTNAISAGRLIVTDLAEVQAGIITRAKQRILT